MKTETAKAKARRESHVIIRALDAVMWADPRDERAAKRIINRIFRSGDLAGIYLPESITEYLVESNLIKYEAEQEEIY